MPFVPFADRSLTRLAKIAARFTRYRVRYCVIGGVAVAVRVPQRRAHDLDLIIEPTMSAGERACAAIGSLAWDPKLVDPNNSVPPIDPSQLAEGEPCVLHTSLGTLHILGSHLPAGCERDSIVRRRTWYLVGTHRIAICSLDDLIHIKGVVGRSRDIDDLRLLSGLRR